MGLDQRPGIGLKDVALVILAAAGVFCCIATFVLFLGLFSGRVEVRILPDENTPAGALISPRGR